MRNKILSAKTIESSPELTILEKEATKKLAELRELLQRQEAAVTEKLEKFKEWLATQRDYILKFEAHKGRWPKGVAENMSKTAYSIASRIWESFTYLEEPKHCDKYVEYVDKLTAYYNWGTRCQRKLEKDGAEETAETEQKATSTICQKIWACIKRIPRWIYILVIFLAALLTIFHYLGWI